MTTSSTPMSDDIEIREPAAKHTSPSEGLKRFTASESDEQREQVKQLMQDMHCTTHMPDCADWCDGDDVFLSGLMRIVAQHTKDAVERECLKARMDENRLARNAMEPNEALGVPYVPSFDLYTSNRNHALELELAAPAIPKTDVEGR